jgi:hypothetical protein
MGRAFHANDKSPISEIATQHVALIPISTSYMLWSIFATRIFVGRIAFVVAAIADSKIPQRAQRLQNQTLGKLRGSQTELLLFHFFLLRFESSDPSFRVVFERCRTTTATNPVAFSFVRHLRRAQPLRNNAGAIAVIFIGASQ